MAKIKTDGLERTVSARLPLELFQWIESRVDLSLKSQAVAEQKAKKADREYRPHPDAVRNTSDAIRKLCNIGRKVLERDAEFLADLAQDHFADRLATMLAIGCNDPDARAMLAKIAKRARAKTETPPSEDWP
jgi:hypothetical protein